MHVTIDQDDEDSENIVGDPSTKDRNIDRALDDGQDVGEISIFVSIIEWRERRGGIAERCIHWASLFVIVGEMHWDIWTWTIMFWFNYEDRFVAPFDANVTDESNTTRKRKASRERKGERGENPPSTGDSTLTLFSSLPVNMQIYLYTKISYHVIWDTGLEKKPNPSENPPERTQQMISIHAKREMPSSNLRVPVDLLMSFSSDLVVLIKASTRLATRFLPCHCGSWIDSVFFQWRATTVTEKQ